MIRWYRPTDPTPTEQCPCCDYISLSERGQYLICPICFWEDEGLDIDTPDEYSGPNHGTLRKARKNFEEFGACDKQMVVNVIPVVDRKQYERVVRVLPPSC